MLIKKLCLISMLGLWISGGLIMAQNRNFDPNLTTSEIAPLLIQHQADKDALGRLYIAQAAPETSKRFERLSQTYLDKLKQVKFANLSRAGQVDYILLKRNLNLEIEKYQLEIANFSRLQDFYPFAHSIYQLAQLQRRGKRVDGRKCAETFHQTTLEIKTLITNLKDKKLPRNDVIFIQRILNGTKASTNNFYQFYFGYDPLFTWWAPKPYEALINHLEEYHKKIYTCIDSSTQKPVDASGISGNPIGADKIISSLRREMIPYTPEELIAIAHQEFAWCDREMLKASREMGFGSRWKEAMEAVKNSHVAPGEQPEMINRLHEESVAFIRKYDLLTIPPLADEVWRMGMMSPKRQLVNPFFTGGERITISYPTHTMDHEDKLMSMRGNNPHYSRATVHHELIAGHHLQQFMNRRYRNYRSFHTPFWTEGWALYWELLLYDMEFPESPQDRIGMLFWRMHRCARIIFSLNYHLGKWSPQQCIDFLVERVNHERANAEGEVRRSFEGGYSPLYQVAYLIGGLQFWALKKELVDQGKMTFRQFHDAVLLENNIPVEMVRTILTDDPLSENYETKWRFYAMTDANPKK